MLDSTRTRVPVGVRSIPLRVSLVLLAVGQLVSCRHHVIEVPPPTRVTGVEMIHETPDGTQLAINVIVENPNLIAVPLVRADYTLVIDGVGSFNLADKLNRTVPAGVEAYGSPVGRQIISLPAAVAGNNVSLVGRDYKVHGVIYYRQGHSFLAMSSDSKMRLQSTSFNGMGRVISTRP